jgi:hypothetical protein
MQTVPKSFQGNEVICDDGFVCFLLVCTTTHRSLKAYFAILVRSFQLSPPGVSTRITTPEHLAAEGGTVGEKCPVILPK